MRRGILTIVLALVLGGVALAALAALDVPKIDTPPSLDPRAPASGWTQPAPAALTWDVVHARPASELTEMRTATDGKFLYVRFDAKQQGSVVISQHGDDAITGGSNGSNGTLSWSNDDAVWVDLWPNGAGGFEYQFEANPGGSHNEYSTENTAFAPHWESRGATVAGRIRRHDGDPAERDSRRARGRVACAIHPIRPRDRCGVCLVVRCRADECR